MASDRGPDSFLEDFSPLSQALVGAQMERREHAMSASNVYITIENEKCFKCFDSAFAEGHGNIPQYLCISSRLLEYYVGYRDQHQILFRQD